MRKREARQRKDTSEWEVGKTRRKEGIAKSEKGREEKGNRERTTTAVFGEGGPDPAWSAASRVILILMRGALGTRRRRARLVNGSRRSKGRG